MSFLRSFKRSPSTKELDLILPNHGYLYFDNLYSEYRCHPTGFSEKEEAIIKELILLKEQRKLTWKDLYTMELLIARHLPKERLSRTVWMLRLRYKDIVGLSEYEAYLASKPPDLDGQVEEVDLRADIEYLLREIYLRYAITPFNEKLLNNISKKVSIVIIGCIGVLIFVILFRVSSEWFLSDSKPEERRPASMVLVLFIGALGGLLSVQHRYQSIKREGDPIENISEMMQGWPRIFFPAITGALFALLLFMIFVGGLIKGELFPEFIGVVSNGLENETDGSGIGFAMLLEGAQPCKTEDYAKLFVWSFLAGFAERFVPDTLSRFVSSKEGATKVKA